jgi:helix-turn-helix protein
MQSILSTGASKAERDGRCIVKSAVRSGDAVKLGFSIKEAASASGLSRSLLYLAIAEGKLCARKCRGRTIVLRDDFERFLESLPALKGAA